MEIDLNTANKDEPIHKVEVDWAEAEWFQVWLRLARRDYHGYPSPSQLHADDPPLAA